MNDRYRTLMERSFKDAFRVAEDVEEEYGITIPPDAYPQMAMGLYRNRVQEYRKKVAEMEAKANEYTGSPNLGRR